MSKRIAVLTAVLLWTAFSLAQSSGGHGGGGGGGGAVSSVFSRTGVVVATSGDYSFSLISGSLSKTQAWGTAASYDDAAPSFNNLSAFPNGIKVGGGIPNDTVTGTANNLLAKISAANKLIKAATTDTNVPVVIVTSGGGTSGNAFFATGGTATCTFDNTAVAGDYVVASTTAAGQCHDAGATQPTGVWIVGQALSAGTSNQTVLVPIGTTLSSAGTVRLDQVTDPTANKTFTMGANRLTFNYGAATGAATDMTTFADSANNTGTGAIVKINGNTSTAAVPLVVNQTTANSTPDIADFDSAGTRVVWVDGNGNFNMSGLFAGQGATVDFQSNNGGDFRFKNSSGTVTSGITTGGASYVSLTATAALTAGQVVKVDSANASSVVVAATTDTGGGIAVGIVTNSPGAGGQAFVATSGIVTTPVLGTGTCAIGNFVIVDTTTAGRVKCTATYSAGTVIGKALTTQNTVGSAVTVLVGLK